MTDFEKFGDMALEITARRATGIDTMSVLSGALSELLDSSAHLSACLSTLVGGLKANESAVSINQLSARVAAVLDSLQAWSLHLSADRSTRDFQKFSILCGI